MTKSRPKRRKEARPGEITAAAMEAFAEHGYDGTRIDDVAQRAGISKGLLYLYFKTKEELFKAVIRSFVSPHVAKLIQVIDEEQLTVEAFLRGPFLSTAKKVPKPPLRVLVRLMVAEGPKHPDLTAYYWENVIAPALDAIRRLLDRGIAAGEIRPSALNDYPQLLVTPVLFSALWKIVFQRHNNLDTDALLDAHVDFLVAALKPSEAVQ